MSSKPEITDTFKTRPTLLSKVRRGDEEGWSQFYEVYRGFIYNAGRGAGLSHEESSDLVQDTMLSIRDYIHNFVPDKNRGRFRTWVRRIVQSRVADVYRGKKRNPLDKAPRRPPPEESATSATNRIPDLNEVDLDRLIDGKLEQAILTEARRLTRQTVRMEDYQAYDLFVLQELSADKVGGVLGVGTATVRVRAFRVRRALEREIRRVTKLLERPKRFLHDSSEAPQREAVVQAAHRVTTEPGYQFIKEVGRGGYGYVYLFRDSHHRRGYVAAKFIYRHVFGPEEDPASNAAYQRALDGLQNFRSLSKDSPYLLRVSDVRQRHEAGYFCYMMELADDLELGQEIEPMSYKPRTLKNEIERGGPRKRLPAMACLEIATALAHGLQLLHDAGYTHRDVRPSNIIFVNAMPKLADIDLLAGHDAALPSYIPKHYAAPEGSHSRQADIYSLGKTIYEMCTGLPVEDYPALPPDIGSWADYQMMLRINKIIARACERNLRRRYQSVQQLVNDLLKVC